MVLIDGELDRSVETDCLVGGLSRFVVHRGFVNERRAKEDATWSCEFRLCCYEPLETTLLRVNVLIANDSKDENGDELISNSIMVTTDVR